MPLNCGHWNKDWLKVLVLLATTPTVALSPCAPQTDHLLAVRILDAGTHKPLKGVPTGVSVLSKEDRRKTVLNATTDADGVAIFHLADPVPERFGLVFAPDELRLCSNAEFSTGDVLNKGLVGTNSCSNSKWEYSGPLRAGEIIVFGKTITLWQRILREIPL